MVQQRFQHKHWIPEQIGPERLPRRALNYVQAPKMKPNRSIPGSAFLLSASTRVLHSVIKIQRQFFVFYQAPSMRKLLRLGGASAALTSTSSTRAARGPCLSLASRTASCCSLPLARTSTAQSTLLRTQPARPSIGLALHKP